MDGIPIGEYDRTTGKLKIYNHLSIEVKVHRTNTQPYEKRIVGFNVRAMSRAMKTNSPIKCDYHTEEYEPFYMKAGEEFMFSYCYRTVVSITDSI